MKVKGKLALITGGAQGLGKAYAEVLLQNGGKVCLLDVDIGKGLDTVNAFNQEFGFGSCSFIKCDVTSKEQMEYAFAHAKATYGVIDIVVNNAGISNEKRWEKMVEINLTAVIRGSFLAIQYMKKKNGGRGGLIINVASLAGIDLMPLGPVYSASKFGCVGISRNLGKKAEKDPDLQGIRVSCICPGFTETELFLEHESNIDLPANDPLFKMYQKAVKVVGILKMADVARAFMALVEDDRAQGGVLAVSCEGAIYVNPSHLQGSKL